MLVMDNINDQYIDWIEYQSIPISNFKKAAVFEKL